MASISHYQERISSGIQKRGGPAKTVIVTVFGNPRTLKRRLERGVLGSIGFTLGTLVVLALLHGQFVLFAVSLLALAPFAFLLNALGPRAVRVKAPKGVHRRPRRSSRARTRST